MNVLLRLGCALLACVGIAVARTPVGPADEASAARRAQEHRAAPVIKEGRDVSVAPSSENASVRSVRRARSDSRRSSPVAAVRSRTDPQSMAASDVSSAPSCSVAFADVRSSSPRAPPASA
jgi:hypothetical protein